MANDGTAASAAPGAPDPNGGVDAEAQSGADYEVIRRRLLSQGVALRERLDGLNQRRVETFGSSALEVLGQVRVRTEHACVPRDIVQVRGRLLFGYAVEFQLKEQVDVQHVLSLHRFEHVNGDYDLGHVPAGGEDAQLLEDPRFVADFNELFRYYRDAKLIQLRRTAGKLLAVVQTGATTRDVKVLRWSIEPDGSVRYVDNRGDRDHVFPEPYDFKWVLAGRDAQVTGTHPHLNILDTLFVETLGGDLTIKVENNTSTGRGIYSEPVDDVNQTLDDGEFRYAKVGDLILLRVHPFREEKPRYLVYDPRAQRVVRLDAIGQACRQLPEGHGIVFPGGYYLQTGDYKVFDAKPAGMELKTSVRAPNGEDVLYVFHERVSGRYALLPYNLIRKEMQTPIQCHGYSIFDDGEMIVFRSESAEPSRVHPMQVWRTPFCSAEVAAAAPMDGSLMARIGNAELVRGLSDAYAIGRLTETAEPQRHTFEDLIRAVDRALDAYFWLDESEVGLRRPLIELRATADSIVGEFEKVLALRDRAKAALEEARGQQVALLDAARSEQGSVAAYMQTLSSLRRHQGRLVALEDLRFMDLARVAGLREEAKQAFEQVSETCVHFLTGDQALRPIAQELTEIEAQVADVTRVTEMVPLDARLVEVSEGLTVISEVVAGLSVDDATVRTRILEAISAVLGQQNRVRAVAQARRKSLAAAEGKAEFAAQFQLLSQSVASALAAAETPEGCDTELTRLMVQVEELEARFSELDEFLSDIAEKREEIQSAFDAKKQRLLDERNRRVQNLVGAAERILTGVRRRAASFGETEGLEAYFAADPMLLKLREIADKLRALGGAVHADEVESKTKSARQDALRGLRDKLDLFGGGGDLIRFGRHEFSVNDQPFELSLVPRAGGLSFHVAGTDYFTQAEHAQLEALRPLFEQSLVSESPEVYRGEYLAATLLFEAEEPSTLGSDARTDAADGDGALTLAALHAAQREPGGLLALVQARARDRYDEGYERGVHDADAAAILERLLTLLESAGPLRFAGEARAAAMLFWGHRVGAAEGDDWQRRARSLGRLRERFGEGRAFAELADELGQRIAEMLATSGLAKTAARLAAPGLAAEAGAYLAEILRAPQTRFVVSAEAAKLRERLQQRLDLDGTRRDLDEELSGLSHQLPAQHGVALAWLTAFGRTLDVPPPEPVLHEAAALWLSETVINHEASAALLQAEVTELLGQHPRIVDRRLGLRVDELLPRLRRYQREQVPAFRALRALRHELISAEAARLRLEELRPRVMTSFVRNRLIDEVYLPMVGDNLAKQMGAAGATKRTDLMGLLLLVSPPGYGKTTLMEYVASRLGLAFVKVNGPSLGHQVLSLDPAEAPNATARQEVE
ncbi:MAG: DNA repair ATPase, partial [Myxococcales bacterium]|nr:DNA repair ATPase [Myxococcales bacterium]